MMFSGSCCEADDIFANGWCKENVSLTLLSLCNPVLLGKRQ